ncbi:hypothetical protein LRP52_40885 [Photobacterium sp. ZSDE20]|uniref:Uncharacterized protein n=1 Tax=Photobacterium pectinilyticum TaxID=2906793 RepID=A0ABT1N7S8_9GAMM|nr:hypothetical protein [Photobacterium sp. ZSDE20]MCQ1060793.1 hypothetical protein [Photobacterium sp. ZSDE20]MDD1828541.1 hypothetical protein [Photobacterium sp. ZSDE20]
MVEFDGIDHKIKRRCYIEHLMDLQRQYRQAACDSNRNEIVYLEEVIIEVKRELMSSKP